MAKQLSEEEQIKLVRDFLKTNGFDVVNLIKQLSGVLSELHSLEFKLDFLRSSLLTKEDRLKSLEGLHKIIHGDDQCAE